MWSAGRTLLARWVANQRQSQRLGVTTLCFLAAAELSGLEAAASHQIQSPTHCRYVMCAAMCCLLAQDILFCSKEAVFKPPKAIRCVYVCCALIRQLWSDQGPGWVGVLSNTRIWQSSVTRRHVPPLPIAAKASHLLSLILFSTCSWRPIRQANLLLCCCCRGGVPVCFPQFGQLGPLGQHGFARNSAFSLLEETDDSVVLVGKGGNGTGGVNRYEPLSMRICRQTDIDSQHTLSTQLAGYSAG